MKRTYTFADCVRLRKEAEKRYKSMGFSNIPRMLPFLEYEARRKLIPETEFKLLVLPPFVGLYATVHQITQAGLNINVANMTSDLTEGKVGDWRIRALLEILAPRYGRKFCRSRVIPSILWFHAEYGNFTKIEMVDTLATYYGVVRRAYDVLALEKSFYSVGTKHSKLPTADLCKFFENYRYSSDITTTYSLIRKSSIREIFQELKAKNAELRGRKRVVELTSKFLLKRFYSPEAYSDAVVFSSPYQTQGPIRMEEVYPNSAKKYPYGIELFLPSKRKERPYFILHGRDKRKVESSVALDIASKTFESYMNDFSNLIGRGSQFRDRLLSSRDSCLLKKLKDYKV
jgi:hypothetical protein